MTRLGSENLVDTLRHRCVDIPQHRVLVSDIARSTQATDLSVPPNCSGIGRIRHFRTHTANGWPPNVLPALPASLWLKRPMQEETKAQVFQLSGCPLRCWYCYVPYPLLSGNQHLSQWKSASDLIDLYLKEENRPDIIDLSGGAPELAPEWVSWMISELRTRELDQKVFLWSDDSLTTDLLLRPSMRDILKIMEQFGGYGKVCCLKGISPASFQFTTGADGEGFSRQLDILCGYLRTGLNLYGYITFAFPEEEGLAGTIDSLLDKIQSVDETFPARIVPLRVERFMNMVSRTSEHRNTAMRYQDEVVEIWEDRLSRRGLSSPLPEGPLHG